MLFLQWHIFHDVRITFFCGAFALRMEINLKLRFGFVRHCDVFFVTLQLRYLFVRCSYVFWWRWNYVIFWYVRITYGNDMTITFCFCWSLWCIFLLRCNYVIYLFDVVTFFDDVRITLYFGTSNYVWKWRDNYVSFLFVIVTYFYYVTIKLFLCLM